MPDPIDPGSIDPGAARPAGDPVIAALRGLSATLVIDAPAADLEAAVLHRLRDAPIPARSRGIAALAGDVAEGLRRRWRAATAVAVALLLVVLAVTPAGAAIIEWLGIGGVTIVQEPAPSGAAPPPDVGDTAGQDSPNAGRGARRRVVPAGGAGRARSAAVGDPQS